MAITLPHPYKVMPQAFKQVRWVLNELDNNRPGGNNIPAAWKAYRAKVLEKLGAMGSAAMQADCISDVSKAADLEKFLGTKVRLTGRGVCCVDQAITLAGLGDNIGTAFPTGEKFTWELPHLMENLLRCPRYKTGNLAAYSTWESQATRSKKFMVAFFTANSLARIGHMMLVTHDSDGTMHFKDSQDLASGWNPAGNYVLAWEVPGSNGVVPADSHEK